ncbi:BRCT domain-containing protein [Primorskyibacter sp. 2E233]|uniref:BRCT domain-containing protein n=1 Tax=Primorskyibacter sp. 2E233 TaxID=3413431 RepID=UPI003BF0FC60
MDKFETGSRTLARIHKAANDKKYFCYFTGFLEGIVASGRIEAEEIPPLISQCEDFIANIGDADASEIIEDFDVDLLEFESLENAIEYRGREIDTVCPKSSTNRFLGYCAGISCDGKITIDEARILKEKIDEAPVLLNDPICRSLKSICNDALEDGIIDPSESAEICNAITRLIGDAYNDTGISELGNVPVFEPHPIAADPTELEGANLVLTGSFSITPRRILEEHLEAHGSIIFRSVSRKTSFVVVASEASRDWVHTHKGTKIIRALKLQEETGKPRFISEADLLTLLGMRP